MASPAEIKEALAATPRLEMVDLPFVQEKFVSLYSAIHGVQARQADMMYQAEKLYFRKIISTNKDLKECDPLTLYGAFLECAVNGLSFDPNKKLAYLLPSNVNVGTKEAPVWAKHAAMVISPYGELGIRQMNGQIKSADNPVIVYEGDVFEPSETPTGKQVKYVLNVNHGTKIIGAFIKITREDLSIDYSWLLQSDIDRLKGYSERKNKGHANALYTSMNGGIDPGFLGAKMIKHAFKSYPKVNLRGDFSKTEEQIKAEQAPIDYGLGMGNGAQSQLPESKIPANPAVQNEALSPEARKAILQATAEETPATAATLQVTATNDEEGF